MAYELVGLAEAQTYLRLDTVPDVLTQLIANISARIEVYTGRWFITRSTTDILDSGGGPILFLRRYPIQNTPLVTDLITNEAISDFIVYAKGGYLFRETNWLPGRQRYKVEYTAGMCADTASVPADVKQAALEWITARYNRPDPAVTREAIGDYSYSADEKEGMPANVRAALSPYVVPRGW